MGKYINDKKRKKERTKHTSRRCIIYCARDGFYVRMCVKTTHGLEFEARTTTGAYRRLRIWFSLIFAIYTHWSIAVRLTHIYTHTHVDFGIGSQQSVCWCVVHEPYENAVDKYYRILPKPYSSKSTLLHEPNAQFEFSRVAAAPELHIVRISQAHIKRFNFIFYLFDPTRKKTHFNSTTSEETKKSQIFRNLKYKIECKIQEAATEKNPIKITSK